MIRTNFLHAVHSGETELFLFGTEELSLYEWVCNGGISPHVERLIEEYSGAGLYELKTRLQPDYVPFFGVCSGEEAGSRWWIFDQDGFRIPYRVLYSFDRGFLPTADFRDKIILPGMIGWESIYYAGVLPHKAYDVAIDFRDAINRDPRIYDNQLAGEEFDTIIPPPWSFRVPPRSPITASKKPSSIGEFHRLRKDVRDARRHARKERRVARKAARTK